MTNRRQFLAASTATAFSSLLPLGAQAALVADKDYAMVEFPQPTRDASRVEVLELFFYGCPHCFELEPLIVPWSKRLPRHAYFRRQPAIFSDAWIPMAKAFYAAEALGVAERLHGDFFNAIHLQGINLNFKSTLLQFVGSRGVDANRFGIAYDSKEVQDQVAKAREATSAYGINGVPAMVVDGKYRTSSSMVGSHERLLPALDELVAMAHREHGRKR